MQSVEYYSHKKNWFYNSNINMFSITNNMYTHEENKVELEMISNPIKFEKKKKN